MRLRVFGRIQGVGFRSWAYRHALRLGIRGWVRNEADGTVICECQGQADALQVFTAALRRGPPFARVDRIEANQIPPARKYHAFEIEY
ncbi:MAG: acylphosphatase [Spirochaetia bacterium]|nr:acylphosphatase [Spirochaetia bacterium]